METSRSTEKPFKISRDLVWAAYQKVKANKGAPGVDEQSVAMFEKDLKNNLYRVWNRMSSGSYFSPPVRAVEIPKAHGGGVRLLGVPTVADRVAQTVVAMMLEPRLEEIFQDGSYGYRRGRSALDAVAACRERCWKRDWVVDLDIQDFFGSCPHDLIIKAVEANTDQPWVVLYVRRWLSAPVQYPDGSLVTPDRGTPAGSAVSPVLANAFLHYALDLWLAREFPGVPYERYVDDAVVHCVTRRQAEQVRAAIGRRLEEVGLRLHPAKTRVVYCKDNRRRGMHEHTAFTFLGYTFRPRRQRNKKEGRNFTSFDAAISGDALKAKSREIRSWRIHCRTGGTLDDLANMMNPIVRGWMNYWGRFNRYEMFSLLRRINAYLMKWAQKKYKRLRGYKRVKAWWKTVVERDRGLFAHWAWERSAWMAG
ncbi:group II intron reverse transcriptase/maturase [Pseudofrankia sp. BMG5.37]|uniref:group II intron reverse transcriptase/maturase n=1 Tax=Pseudofrankia sp. BMG5.37 TaxID=3050035 RepID=UPI002893A499|nr:group II intron reverse transcriptase/maturase [Pseudofrankia sp. BMG5.37]MDT3443837.1 group II intron reverse transcriptase/maturase [Pseudofrankia sp. BMG5.37]